jgi:alkylation response protein AidB-like acyl-CoA dehydrogenase
LGIARGICERTLRHVQNRRVFGQSLSDFEVTQFKFFSFWREMEAGRLMALRAAFDWDRGVEAFRIALAALVHNFKVAQDVTDEAVQLHGGYSYFEEMGVAMTYRDAKMLKMIWDDSFNYMKHLWPQLANTGAWRI